MALRFQAGQSVTFGAAEGGGATTLSLGIRVKVDVAPTSASYNRYVLWGDKNKGSWAFELGPDGTVFFLSLVPSGGWTYEVVTLTAGKTYDLVMVTSGGVQTFYVNGALNGTASTAGALGAFGGSLVACQPEGGGTDATAPDITMERLWAALAVPTAADVYDLSTKAKSPADVFGLNLLTYFTLDGTAGQAASATDPGLTDTRGAVPTVTLAGSPVYAAALTLPPQPVVATPHLTPSGESIYFLFTKLSDGTRSVGGANQAGPTVATHPTVSVNGGAGVQLGTPAPLACVDYLLYQLPTAVNTATDTVTATGPGLWASTADGSTGALSATATVLDPLPATPSVKTLKVGWNVEGSSVANPISLTSNMLRQASNVSYYVQGGTHTFAANGEDLSDLNGYVAYWVSGNGYANGTSRSGYPTQQGTWTVVWPTGPTCTFYDNTSVATITQLGSDVVSGGFTTRQYTLTMPDGTGAYDASLYVRFDLAGGAFAVTQAAVYPPGEPTDGSKTYGAALQRLAGPAPHSLRFMDATYTNSCNVVTFDDWTPDARFFLDGAKVTTLDLVSVDNYAGDQTYLTGAKGFLFTTATPHGLTLGQTVYMGSDSRLNALTFVSGSYQLTYVIGTVLVLTSTTFVFRYFQALPDLTGPQSFASPYPTATMTVNPALPVVHFTGVCNQLGANCRLNIPHLMPATEQRRLIDAAFAKLAPGLKLELELSNETWNSSVAFQQTFDFAGKAALAAVSAEAYFAQRCSQLFDVGEASAAAAGRSGDLVRVVGGWFGSTARTSAMVSWFTANAKSFDRLDVAPYFSVGPGDTADDPWWSAASRVQAFDANALYVSRSDAHTRDTAAHLAAVAPVAGAGVGCYEGSVNILWPRGTGYAPKALAAFFDPLAAGITTAWLANLQAQGAAIVHYFNLGIMLDRQQDGTYTQAYDCYPGPASLAGVGDGSDGLNDNLTSGADLAKVVSPIGHALNSWMGAATAPSFGVTPSSVVVSSTTSLSLVGAGTSWTSSTTFTPSGGSVLSKSVADATHATLSYQAPASAGTVTLSDGTSSATLTVSPAPTMAVSPISVAAGSQTSLGLTGTNTAWTSSTTFTASAGVLSGASVADGTHASASYTAPASPGTVTLGDGTASTLLTVSPSPTPTPTPTPAPSGTRDRSILRLIAGLLEATNEFHGVTTGGLPADAGNASAEVLKLASLELAGFSEQTFGGEKSDQGQVRDVAYTLTISVRDNDPDARDDEADRLACVAQNALDGVSVGGETVVDRTRLGRGQYLPATSSERQVRLTGSFTYFLGGYSTHFVTPS